MIRFSTRDGYGTPSIDINLQMKITKATNGQGQHRDNTIWTCSLWACNRSNSKYLWREEPPWANYESRILASSL